MIMIIMIIIIIVITVIIIIIVVVVIVIIHTFVVPFRIESKIRKLAQSIIIHNNGL